MDLQLLELLRKRRSIRKFTDRPVEAEKIDAIIEAAVRTPSSRGLNPWEFIVVADPQLIRQLGRAKASGSGFVAGAALAVVVAANPERCDVWIEDCSIAAMVIQLVAEELGLGSCWAQIRLRPHDASRSATEYLRSLLDLPENFEVECIIGIGYPAESPAGHARASLPFDQVHRDRYRG